MKRILFVLAVVTTFALQAQQVHRTRAFLPSIKTLQARISGHPFVLPVMELASDDKLTVSFDEMSHESHSYSYKVFHCNADWTLSDIHTSEYLSGFTSANITDYATSLNTTLLYTHYSFSLPNADMQFKISGNYVVKIYEDNREDQPVAQVCFSIVEPRVKIGASVRGNTDTELSGKLQQLDFEVDMGGYAVRDPASEIKVVVRQNNRIDNEVTGLKPTYLTSSKLSYVNNRALIFEGGSEYHRFDFSSEYAGGEGVSHIRYTRPHYDVYLYDNKIMADKSYVQDQDVNGEFVVNLQRSDYDDTEADYMYVHFNLPVSQPFFDGQLYVGGEFNQNQMNDENRMKYNAITGSYSQAILLKQGGYNYQFWFVPKGQTQASTTRVDGSYWQTRNEYTIYVYQRPWGERYDKLIGVKGVE